MRDFLVAWHYLTALPLPVGGPGGDLGRAAGWFPVVGLVLGAILAGAAVGVGALAPPLVTATLVVALWAGLTGGLHLDGLADTLDGLGGGWSRADALAIMRDAGVGAYGVAGIALVLALKIAALTSLPAPLRPAALVTAAALARVGPLVLARLCPPARADGAGHAFALSVSPTRVAAAAAVGAAVALVLARGWGLLLVAAVAGDAAAFALYLRRRLGGFTGDCLGALVEVGEAGVLVLLSALAYLALL